MIFLIEQIPSWMPRFTSSDWNAFVNAWMRNLNGRKSGDSSRRAIFFGMSVWWIGSPRSSVASRFEQSELRNSWKMSSRRLRSSGASSLPPALSSCATLSHDSSTLESPPGPTGIATGSVPLSSVPLLERRECASVA